MAKFKNLDTQSKEGILTTIQKWGKNALAATQRLFNRLVKSGSYDLYREIEKNPWYTRSNGGALAQEWFKTQIVTHSEWQQRRTLMEPGRLYMFVYDNPKTADVLDWWDVYPLVLSLGNYKAEGTGNIVEMGINLHHLPLKVRFLVLSEVFKAFANLYRGEMYRAEQSPVQISWMQVGALVEKYGASFAFRSYLPELRTGSICFPYEEWSKAIYIPSQKYEKLQAAQIYARYIEYLRKRKIMFTVPSSTY
jgi:hypothetical protein